MMIDCFTLLKFCQSGLVQRLILLLPLEKTKSLESARIKFLGKHFF